MKMKATKGRWLSRCRVPFGFEPLEARLQFAGDLTFDASFSPDIQSALDHAIIAKGHTTAHLESSGLGLVLELTGDANTLLSVAADEIPLTIAGVKVLEASQFSIRGSREFAFLNLSSVAQAKVTGIQVQYSLYADNVGELQADAHQLPVTVTGSAPTIFYSTSFAHSTVLNSAANLTLSAPVGVDMLSLVLLQASARVHLGFSVNDLTIYGGGAAQVDHTSFRHGYTPPSILLLTAPAAAPVSSPVAVTPPVADPLPPVADLPPVTVIPPISIPATPAAGVAVASPIASDTAAGNSGVNVATSPVVASNPVFSTPPLVVLTDPPLVITTPPPPETVSAPVAAAPAPVASVPSVVIDVTPPAPPVVSHATGEAAIPEFLRGLIYLASLNLISFDDQTQAHIGLLLGRAGAAGIDDAITIKSNLTALDSLDHRHGTESFYRYASANHKPALADEALPLPSLSLVPRVAEGRKLAAVPLPTAVAASRDHGVGDTVPALDRTTHLPVLRPSSAEGTAGQPPRLFAGEASAAAIAMASTVFLPVASLRAFGSLLADHLQAEFTPGERTAVLISESRLAGSSFHV